MGNQNKSSEGNTNLNSNRLSLIKTLKAFGDILPNCIKEKHEEYLAYSKSLQQSIRRSFQEKLRKMQLGLALKLIKIEIEEELLKLLELRLQLALKHISIPEKREYFNNHIKSIMFITNYLYFHKIINNNISFKNTFQEFESKIKQIYDVNFWEYFSIACIDKKANKLAFPYETILSNKYPKDKAEQFITNFFQKNGETYLDTIAIDDLY